MYQLQSSSPTLHTFCCLVSKETGRPQGQTTQGGIAIVQSGNRHQSLYHSLVSVNNEVRPMRAIFHLSESYSI